MERLSGVRPLVPIHQLLWRNLSDELLLFRNEMNLGSLLASMHERTSALPKGEASSTIHSPHACHTHRESRILLGKRIVALRIIIPLWLHVVMLGCHLLGCWLTSLSLRGLAHGPPRVAPWVTAAASAMGVCRWEHLAIVLPVVFVCPASVVGCSSLGLIYRSYNIRK